MSETEEPPKPMFKDLRDESAWVQALVFFIGIFLIWLVFLADWDSEPKGSSPEAEWRRMEHRIEQMEERRAEVLREQGLAP